MGQTQRARSACDVLQIRIPIEPSEDDKELLRCP